MTAINTTILSAALDADHAMHRKESDFIDSLSDRSDVIITDLVLVELPFCCGIRWSCANRSMPVPPCTCASPCGSIPCGKLSAFRPTAASFWPCLRTQNFARRRAWEWRIALSLLQQGVNEFATVNEKDFLGFGFKRVWNPLVVVSVDCQGAI